MITRLKRTAAAILTVEDYWLTLTCNSGRRKTKQLEVLMMRAGDRRDADKIFSIVKSVEDTGESYAKGVIKWAYSNS